ncbi:LacI family DNA-binding transcriptional regulator [Caballeronia sp. dw_19]|uniref:LacI family DNA-binding transcriptional regulator n=1 Tax=Caballeronia sp. dw_19 TaxID=2719791 RepID=UPI001BD51DC7|nr:LacI family DNA-binding transcriptional regulator [Caballeronia sp. dw_19]
MKRTKTTQPEPAIAIGRTKLKDVADRAGVSISTVSRVMNSPHMVREAVRENVERVLAELGYFPDPAARALSSKRMNTIGIIVPILGTAIFSDWVVALQKRLDEHGFSLLISSSEYDPPKEYEDLLVLLNRGVDGIILIGDNHLPETYALLSRRNVPALCAFTHHSSGGLPCVGFDHRAAARELAEYLIRIGHREIGVIASPFVHNDRIQARVQGVRDAISGAGLALPESRLVEVPYSIEDGRRAFARLINNEPKLTAIMCMTDILAFGATLEATRLGYRIPDHVTLTGFDDLEFARHLIPPLTTVRVAAREIGSLCADRIVQALANESVPLTLVATEALIRASSAPPRI